MNWFPENNNHKKNRNPKHKKYSNKEKWCEWKRERKKKWYRSTQWTYRIFIYTHTTTLNNNEITEMVIQQSQYCLDEITCKLYRSWSIYRTFFIRSLSISLCLCFLLCCLLCSTISKALKTHSILSVLVSVYFQYITGQVSSSNKDIICQFYYLEFLFLSIFFLLFPPQFYVYMNCSHVIWTNKHISHNHCSNSFSCKFYVFCFCFGETFSCKWMCVLWSTYQIIFISSIVPIQQKKFMWKLVCACSSSFTWTVLWIFGNIMREFHKVFSFLEKEKCIHRHPVGVT